LDTAMLDWLIQNWINIWTFAQATASIAVAGIAWFQIGALRKEQSIQQQFHKNWETLKACEKYDTDPVLTESLKILRDARNSGDLLKFPKNYSLEMITILNFLEGIIIGIEQRFYNEDVVYDHLKPIIEDHINEFLSEPCRSAILVGQTESYSRLTRKSDEWKQVRFKLRG
jgi:hypothetical protein